jgi:hypothetical protein
MRSFLAAVAFAILAPAVLLAACSSDGSNGDGYDGPYANAAPGYRAILTEDGSDYQCEWDEEACPSDCDTNQPPVLENPVYVVNGVVGIPFGVGDHVVVRVPFSDADCNLGCGEDSHGYMGPTEAMDTGGSLCTNYPCDSDSSGVYAGFILGELEVGEYSFHLRMTDACGADSNRIDETLSL